MKFDLLDITSIGIAITIALLNFGLQIWPRLKNRYFGIDTWRFALLADYIRTNKKLPDSIPEKYIISGSVDNPPLLYLILSVFPKNWFDKNQRLFSPAFDFLHSLTVFAMGYLATGSTSCGFLAQTIYGLTPVVPLEASNLSLRTFSSLIFSWTMVAVQAQVLFPHPFAFGVAVIFIVLLAYTHRMSLQVLFFSILAFSAIGNTAAYLWIFFVGLAVAVFSFKGQYLKYLRGQLLLIAFWMYNMPNRLAHQVRGNPTSKNKSPDFVRRIEYLIWKLPVLPFIAANPWILFVFWLMWADPVSMTVANGNPWLTVFIKWSIILFILGLIFNLKYTRFLGEGQRYLEYGTSAVAVVSAFEIYKIYEANDNLLQLSIPWMLGIGCLCIIIFMQKKIVVSNPDKSITPALWAVINFLNQENQEVRIACIPHGLADAVAYFMKNGKALLSDNSIGVWEFNDFWPLITKPLDDVKLLKTVDEMFET